MSETTQMSTLCFVLTFLLATVYAQNRNFTVDPEKAIFLKDGQPFRYVAGAIHYFRVPNEYWDDRLKKLRASGANAVQAYVEWSSHEPEPEQFNFEGDNDLEHFIKLAQANDLLVILRPGPFIDAERDFGGFPYWLLKVDPQMKLRTNDPGYLKYVDKWFSTLLPRLKQYLYHNGGPIISVQVENEYGSFGCDHKYMEAVRDIIRKNLGPEVVLFTVDGYGDTQLKCGKVDNVYATVDFGANIDAEYAFKQQRKYDPHAPLVNTEFYPGWLDHWSEKHHTVNSSAFVQTLDKILSLNASTNIYVFHGGSSFGFTAGSNGDQHEFAACPTSYDYDAPISEAGDVTEKFFDIKNVIEKYLPPFTGEVPASPEKSAYGKVNMSCYALNIFEFENEFSVKNTSESPLTFEAVSQPNGFLLYSTSINFQPSDPALLELTGLNDRAIVFVNEKLQGVLSREQRIFQLPIQARNGDILQILVENQGRLCFGKSINEHKGITGKVMIGPVTLKNWTTSTIPLEKETVISKLRGRTCKPLDPQSSFKPSFYVGSASIQSNAELKDTFLRLDGWHKGVVLLNGFNLGRYWPVAGPQETLYVPKHKLRNDKANDILVFELESSPCFGKSSCFVEFVDKHVIDSSVPYS